MAEPDRIDVAGVSVSHPRRVLFETARITKLDLARYYEAIGRWIVPHVADRPLTLVHCPNGVRAQSAGLHKAPECTFMRHGKVWGPSTLRRVRIREKTKIGEYLIADSVEAVVGLAQMDILEIHTWNAGFSAIERPNRIVMDIDPGEGVGWAAVVAAARVVRDLLQELELASFVKTTGGRGLHVVVPLTPSADWSVCLDFARALAEAIARMDPARYTTKFAKAGRERKMLIDYLRNNRTNTSIAAYSTRAKPAAPVSVPVRWTELSASSPPDRFTVPTVLQRARTLRVDPWKDYWTTRQTLPAHAIEALRRL